MLRLQHAHAAEQEDTTATLDNFPISNSAWRARGSENGFAIRTATDPSAASHVVRVRATITRLNSTGRLWQDISFFESMRGSIITSVSWSGLMSAKEVITARHCDGGVNRYDCTILQRVPRHLCALRLRSAIQWMRSPGNEDQATYGMGSWNGDSTRRESQTLIFPVEYSPKTRHDIVIK